MNLFYSGIEKELVKPVKQDIRHNTEDAKAHVLHTVCQKIVELSLIVSSNQRVVRSTDTTYEGF